MWQLEEKFFSKKQEVLIKSSDEVAEQICDVLSKGIVKGDTIQRGRTSTRYSFNFDRVYDRKS